MANTSKKNEVKRRFTKDEKSFVMQKMTTLTPLEISKELGRKPDAIIKLIDTITQNAVADAVNADQVVEAKEATQSTANLDPQSNNKAPQGMRAGDLMAKRPGVTMMTSAASQALDEFKQKNLPKLAKPHESSIHRIRKDA